MKPQKKALTWAGWILTGLLGLMLTFSAVMKLMNVPSVSTELVGRLGYPGNTVVALGIVELGCVVLFLIPRTAVLGAILLAGYLGGATATHVRAGDPFIGPVIGGMLVWLALYLRDPRIRELVPLSRPPGSPPEM